MAVRLLFLVVCVLAVGGSMPEPAAAAPGPPNASCNGGGCGGWFRSNVTVSWSYDPTGVTGTTGCGSAVLRARPSDAELNGVLLVAAALLLAAAAGGSLLLGIAARSSARHA